MIALRKIARRRLASPAALLAALCGLGQPAAATERPPLPDPLTLDWCLERGARENPAIALDRAVADAAGHRIRPAGSLDDPRFAYELSNVPTGDWDLDSTPMSGQQLRLRQRFPFPGLLANREDAARAGARAAGSLLEDRQARVAAAIEVAWSRLGFAQHALEITDRTLDLLRQLQQIAETRYRVGSGLQQDVLRAQVEFTGRLEERLEREAAVRRAEATLAELLDLPPGARIPRTSEIGELAPVPAFGDLEARLDASSPLLRASAARIEAAAREKRAVELEGYPDFDLGVGYRIRERSATDPVNGDDFVEAGFTVRLPVNRGKWRERVAEQDALLRRARAAERVTRGQLRDALRSAHADLVKTHAEVALLETGLVPQARHSLESSRSGYEVGRVDFLSLLDSEVRLFDAQLRLVRARAERRASFARLEAALGEGIR